MDNYTTETTERLHIDFAKEAYRASNKKDYIKQMTTWIDRREKLWAIQSSVCRDDKNPHLRPDHISSSRHRPSSKALAGGGPVYSIDIAKQHVGTATFQELKIKYRADLFEEEMSYFIVQYSHLQTTKRRLTRRPKERIDLLFTEVNVWHHLKFRLPNFQTYKSDGNYIEDKATITPVGGNGALSGCFPTVVVVGDANKVKETGLEGKLLSSCHREFDLIGIFAPGIKIGRLRVIFEIPKAALPHTFAAEITPPKHLAYIEWYSLSDTKDADSHLYDVRKITAPDQRKASIVELKDVRRTCQLWPKFGPVANKEWTSANVLDKCNHFYLSNFTDMYTFQSFY
jgi:hypothetical protein